MPLGTIRDFEDTFESVAAQGNDNLMQWRREVQTELDAVDLPDAQVVAGKRAPRAFVFTNCLWEFAENNAGELARASHFQLLVDVMRSLDRMGVESHLIDVRHPGRSALFHDPPVVQFTRPWPRDTGTPDPEGFRSAARLLIGDEARSLNFDVIGPDTDDIPVDEYLQQIHARLLALQLQPDDLLIVAGGMLAPYFLESCLPHLPGRKYMFCMSYLNNTIRPQSYYAALSSVPDRTVMKELPVLPQPGNITRMTLGSFGGMNRLARTRNMLQRGCTVVAIGRNVGAAIDHSYTDILCGLRRSVGALRLVVVGNTGLADPSLVAELRDCGVDYEEWGMTDDIGRTLSPLQGSRCVVANPHGAGNAGSLIQAALAGLPLVIYEGNDAETILDREFFVPTPAAMQARLGRLLTSRAARTNNRAAFDRCLVAKEQASVSILRGMAQGEPPFAG